MTYAVRRIGIALLVMVTVSFLTFWSLRLIGTNDDILRAMLNTNYTEANAQRLTRELGLDRPFFVQYLTWLGRLLRGDLGTSFYSRRAVWEILQPGVPVSFQLVLMAITFALALSVPLGIFAAYRAGSPADRMISVLSFSLNSLPGYAVGIFVLFGIAVHLRWFPAGQSVPFSEGPWQATYHLFLPAITLALGLTATFARALRTDMVASLQEDYITLAKSKGLPDRSILLRHALRPSCFTLVTLVGIDFGALIGNALIAEQLFNLNGLGRKVLQALTTRDVPVALSGVMIITFVYIVATTATDLLYGAIDPRVRRLRALR